MKTEFSFHFVSFVFFFWVFHEMHTLRGYIIIKEERTSDFGLLEIYLGNEKEF